MKREKQPTWKKPKKELEGRREGCSGFETLD
jgi:hypothetical protein